MLVTIASLLLAGAQPAPAPMAGHDMSSMPGMAMPAQPAPAAAPAPAADAQPAAAPAPPPPSLPTSGDGAQLLQVLEKICVPAVRGQGVDAVAPSLGFKKNKRDNSWSMMLGTDKNYTVTVLSQGSNKDVCQAEVHFALGQEKPIVDALNIWSFLHDPELKIAANYVNVDPDGIKRVRKSWEHFDDHASTAVNFSTMRKPDDSPLNARFDTGMMFYQERKF
jgi:hypothetical protein